MSNIKVKNHLSSDSLPCPSALRKRIRVNIDDMNDELVIDDQGGWVAVRGT